MQGSEKTGIEKGGIKEQLTMASPRSLDGPSHMASACRAVRLAWPAGLYIWCGTRGSTSGLARGAVHLVWHAEQYIWLAMQGGMSGFCMQGSTSGFGCRAVHIALHAGLGAIHVKRNRNLFRRVLQPTWLVSAHQRKGKGRSEAC